MIHPVNTVSCLTETPCTITHCSTGWPWYRWVHTHHLRKSMVSYRTVDILFYTVRMTDWPAPGMRVYWHIRDPDTVSSRGEDPGVETSPSILGMKGWASPSIVLSHVVLGMGRPSNKARGRDWKYQNMLILHSLLWKLKTPENLSLVGLVVSKSKNTKLELMMIG